MKLIFMGTPEFAVPSLRALVEAGHEIVAVYTQPPRPAGRGQKDRPSPVHHYAETIGLAVRTPESLKSPEEQTAFAALGADAAIVVAYGLLLPKPILEGCAKGCINVHPSLLPRWRGAAPLQRTLMAGDARTGICIMQMDEGLDTGPVLLREELDLPENITAGELHDLLAEHACPLLLKTLEQLENITPQPQAAEGATYAPKISKDEAAIDWHKPAADVLHHIHGLSPFPGAHFACDDEKFKVLKACLAEGQGNPGHTLDDVLTVACGQGAVRLLVVQRAGKKPMDASDMLRGFPIPKGATL